MEKIILIIALLTLKDEKIVQKDEVASFELNTTQAICEKHIATAFRTKRNTPPYSIEVEAICVKP